MKHLHLIPAFLFAFIAVGCSKNDDQDDSSITPDPVSQDQGINASINGGSYSSYNFSESIYVITTGTNGNTLSIDAGDTNGDQITLFMNGTNGFDTGVTKDMGDTDTNNFVNYVLIRQSSPQVSYFSTTGRITITENRTHPTEQNQQLISGNFSIEASTIVAPIQSTTMTGSFIDLAYEN